MNVKTLFLSGSKVAHPFSDLIIYNLFWLHSNNYFILFHCSFNMFQARLLLKIRIKLLTLLSILFHCPQCIFKTHATQQNTNRRNTWFNFTQNDFDNDRCGNDKRPQSFQHMSMRYYFMLTFRHRFFVIPFSLSRFSHGLYSDKFSAS